MAYDHDVSASEKILFKKVVQKVAQATKTRIRELITITGDLGGTEVNVRDLLAKSKYSEAEHYDTKNPMNRSQLDSVWLRFPNIIQDGETIFNEDKMKLAMDPTSMFMEGKIIGVEQGVWDRFMGIRNREDGTDTFEVYGSGILGNRISGANRTSAPLPSSQYIPHANTGMTLEKLIAAREILGLADFGLEFETDYGLYCPITPKQITNLLNIVTATGATLNQFDVEQLKTGRPTTLLGITWIPTNRLPTNAAGNRLNPLWTKKNIVGGFWGGHDVSGRIWNLTEHKNLPYIMVDCYPTATRIEDKGVVVIENVEHA